MTVSDEDGASATSSAGIYVQEQNDYPPTANAGSDIIVRLPTNKVWINLIFLHIRIGQEVIFFVKLNYPNWAINKNGYTLLFIFGPIGIFFLPNGVIGDLLDSPCVKSTSFPITSKIGRANDGIRSAPKMTRMT